MPAVPAVPTMAELGYPGFRGEAWIGLVGPVGMQSADVAHLNEHLAKTLSAPDLSRYIKASGARVIITTPEQFSKMIADDHAYWGKLIKDIGLRVE
jgi:tripartite-type tricarboxylate transporter receptor subunit TctC